MSGLDGTSGITMPSELKRALRVKLFNDGGVSIKITS